MAVTRFKRKALKNKYRAALRKAKLKQLMYKPVIKKKTLAQEAPSS